MKTILTSAVTALCVSLAILWLLPPNSTRPSSLAETSHVLTAFDSNGKRIGPLLGATSTLTDAQVAVDTPTGLVIVGIRPDRFVHATRPFIYFNQADCKGDSYLGIGNEPAEFGAKAAIAGDAQTLFVAKPGEPELLPVKSMLREATCEPFEHEIHAVPAEPVMNLAELYRAPYRIERAGPEPASR